MPFSIINGRPYFLIQLADFVYDKNGFRRKPKCNGYAEFGGKRDKGDRDILETAAREFMEETAAMPYLWEIGSSEYFGNLFEDEYQDLHFLPEVTDRHLLTSQIKDGTEYYYQRLLNSPTMYINNQDSYVVFFLEIPYLPSSHLPLHEDMHIEYEDRYQRICKWVDLKTLNNLPVASLHIRLRTKTWEKKLKHVIQKIENICQSNSRFLLHND